MYGNNLGSDIKPSEKIIVKSDVESVVSVEDVAAADGIFYITLKAKALGSANITITLPNSEKVTLEAEVTPASDDKIIFNDVTFGESSADVTITNNQKDLQSGKLVFAEYDKDGRLLSVKLNSFEAAAGQTISYDNLSKSSEHYNIFVLDSFDSLTPHCEKY